MDLRHSFIFLIPSNAFFLSVICFLFFYQIFHSAAMTTRRKGVEESSLCSLNWFTSTNPKLHQQAGSVANTYQPFSLFTSLNPQEHQQLTALFITLSLEISFIFFFNCKHGLSSCGSIYLETNSVFVISLTFIFNCEPPQPQFFRK